MKSKLQSITLAVMVIVGFNFPVTVQAKGESSASIAFANMYLWRGQNVSAGTAAISGSLDYKNSGAYAGIWASSEAGGHETDLYGGYGQSMGLFNFDVSYWKYLYPEDETVLGDNRLAKTDVSDAVISLGVGPISFTTYMAIESGSDSDIYFTLAGSFGKFSAMYGIWNLENAGDVVSNPSGKDEYGHIQFGFQATDALSFSVSKAFSSDDTLGLSVEEDPLFLVSYGLSFDLGKK